MVLTTVQIYPEFGYVILVAVASVFFLLWLSFQVGKARKMFGVKYPTMYDDSKPEFNCYQRSHQNTLENYTQFLLLLFVGGVRHPFIATFGGIVYLAGRYAYAVGYQTGKPEKRMQGSFQYFGLLSLLAASLSTASQILGWF